MERRAVADGAGAMRDVGVLVIRAEVQHLGLQMRLDRRLAIVEEDLPGSILKYGHARGFEVSRSDFWELRGVLQLRAGRVCPRLRDVLRPIEERVPVALLRGPLQAQRRRKYAVQVGE